MNNARKPGISRAARPPRLCSPSPCSCCSVGDRRLARSRPVHASRPPIGWGHEFVVTEATPLVLDVAIAVAWRALPIGGAVVGLAIAWQRWGAARRWRTTTPRSSSPRSTRVHPVADAARPSRRAAARCSIGTRWPGCSAGRST